MKGAALDSRSTRGVVLFDGIAKKKGKGNQPAMSRERVRIERTRNNPFLLAAEVSVQARKEACVEEGGKERHTERAASFLKGKVA